MMLDIECLGTDPGAVILSMAVVPFNLLDQREKGTRWNISIQSSLNEGLWINGDTLQWWLEQKPEILKMQTKSSLPLRHVLKKFSEFYGGKKAQFLWSHGSNFDIPLLAAAYRAVGFEVPWSYRGTRDTRTVYWLARMKGWEPGYIKPADKHDPLADCHRQIDSVLEALSVIEKGGM